METARKLTDDFKSGLKLTYRLTGVAEGRTIEVGEKFKLQFTLTNIAEMVNVAYNNARIFIKGTNYATPTGGDKWYKFTDKHLKHGEQTSVLIEFKANDAWNDPTKIIVDASAWADLDYLTFFSFGITQTVKQSIINP